VKDLEQLLLPDNVREEFTQRLVSGLGVFGHFLSARLKRGEWRIWTIVPQGTRYEIAKSLDWGGVAPADATVAWLSQRIEQFLRQRPSGIAIFENDPATKSDPWLANCKSKVVYMNDRVFHYARSGDSALTIERAIRDAQSYPLVGAIVESVGLNLTHNVEEGDLRKLSLLAVAIIQDVFDGESYMVAEPVSGPSIAPLRL
jgi:hypothetical protein